MTLTIEITVADDIQASGEALPDESSIAGWARAAYQNSIPAVASILITGSDEMQQLNKQYRGHDKPTNVLSFPMQSMLEDENLLLGDIALCAPVINREAEQQSKAGQAHWAHMIVHGMLHLQGYDHEDSDEAEEMEAMEARIMADLGFDNPYQ